MCMTGIHPTQQSTPGDVKVPSGMDGPLRPSLSGGNCHVKRPFRDTCRRARSAVSSHHPTEHTYLKHSPS